MVWALVQAPWMSVGRSRFRFDLFSRAWYLPQLKHHFSVSFQLYQDTPAMEALKRHPYPSTPLDSSVFEDPSSEYDVVVSRPDLAAPKSSNQTLINLVEKGQFDLAECVRAELVEIGEVIFPNKVFEHAAIHALKKANPQRQNRVPQFTNWFSLIPDKLPEEKSRTFYHIRLQLFKYVKPDYLPLVIRFGTLCASKGHAEKVAPQVISFVVRFAQPSISSTFLHEFENGAVKYLEKVQPDRMQKMLKTFWSLAIRTHCLAGRLDEAVKMLRTTRGRNINVSEVTYDLLLQKLADTTSIEIVKELFSTSGAAINRKLRIGSAVESSCLSSPQRQDAAFPTQDYEAIAELPLSAQAPPISVIARNLLYLRKHLVSSTPPSASDLVNFFYAYRSTGRTRGLILLHRKAFRGTQSNTSKSLWLRAEMLFYLHTNRHQLLINTFAKHFYLVGVPAREVTLEVRRFARKKAKKTGMRRELKEVMVSPWIVMNEKLWPTSWHTALVWQALVARWKEGGAEISELYQQLTEMAQSSYPENIAESLPSLSTESLSSRTSSVHGSPLTITPPPIQTITQGHFNPFILHHVQRAHIERQAVPDGLEYTRTAQNLQNATAILNDMINLGIWPNEYTLSTLVRGFADAGDARRSWSVLERMEANNSNSDTTSKATFPVPTVVTYTSIIQGFVQSGDLENALEAEAKMIERLGYAMGSNVKTDAVLSGLRKLQERETRLKLKQNAFGERRSVSNSVRMISPSSSNKSTTT